MDLEDDVLRAEMAIYASAQPCHVPRDALLRLLVLAGFGPHTMIHEEVAAAGDSVLVERKGLLEFIQMARDGEKS